MTDTITEPEIVDENGKGVKLSQPSDSDEDDTRFGKVARTGTPSDPRDEDDTSGGTNVPPEPETFPRDVVEKLREEAAGYRVKAKDRDDLAHRLHLALVAATGRLADPTDLAFDETHIGDENALAAALDDLLTRKPHLATRRPTGSVGQGATPTNAGTDLAGLLRSRA